MRVALLQNRIGPDGRSRWLAATIAALNARDLIPALVTWAEPSREAFLQEFSDAPLQVEWCQLRRPRLVIGHGLQQVVLPWQARAIVPAGVPIITNDTALYGLTGRNPLLRVVSFPIELVRHNEASYRSLLRRAYGVVVAAALRVSRALDRGVPGPILAYGDFTATACRSCYGSRHGPITIVAPPCDVTAAIACHKEPDLVVSVGGFEPAKGQLEQIEIARKCPNLRFRLIGPPRSSRYLRRCQRAAAGLQNVEFVVGAERSEVFASLAAASLFLHSKRNEHFGISTVEAIAQGVLPVVHDSGGQREIVPFADQRFETSDEAVALLNHWSVNPTGQRLDTLRGVIGRYSVESFYENLRPALDELLRCGARR